MTEEDFFIEILEIISKGNYSKLELFGFVSDRISENVFNRWFDKMTIGQGIIEAEFIGSIKFKINTAGNAHLKYLKDKREEEKIIRDETREILGLTRKTFKWTKWGVLIAAAALLVAVCQGTCTNAKEKEDDSLKMQQPPKAQSWDSL